MPPRFFFPSSASPSCLAAALRPLRKSRYFEWLHRKNILSSEVLEDLFQVTVLLHQFVSRFGADTFYWLEVIATEQ